MITERKKQALTGSRRIELGESYLQFLFSISALNPAEKSRASAINHVSDKRAMRVSNQNVKQSSGTSGPDITATEDLDPGSDSDGLLGSMMLEHFAASAFGAFFLPFLPTVLQSCDISALASCADDYFMDRAFAQRADKPQAEYSYF